MTNAAFSFRATLVLVLRAALIVLALAAPVLALPDLDVPQAGVIEAPEIKKKGAGFVLMVRLQRA
jgi:hypothetical protein